MKILYEYEGPFTHEVLKNIGALINEKLFNNLSPRVIKRIFASSNELVQNIGFYSAERTGSGDDSIGVGSVKIMEENDTVVIQTANRVVTGRGSELAGKIRMLNELEEEQLKSLYKEKIKGETDENSKGAGLGFIEIIKRTKNPVQVELEKIDADFSTILIKSIINKEN